MRDMDALADTVVMTVKAAMVPVFERLATMEAKLQRMTEAEQALGALRDRVTTVETKSAMPLQVLESHPVDLSPMLERLASVEAHIARLPVAEQVLGDVRDRLTTVETKAATPVQIPEAVPPVDLTPALERLSAAEARLARVPVVELALGELRDKLIALETKAAIPVTIPEPELLDLAPLEKRLEALEGKSAPAVPVWDMNHEWLEEFKQHRLDPIAHEKELSALRERLAVVETRAPIPGPSGPAGHDGKDGKDGKDGLDGKDGKDGFSLKDFSADFDGNRTLTVKFDDGRLQKTNAIRLPYMRQEGVYIEGRTYGLGDVVTWGGSQWHCNEETTSKPGDGSKAWTLIVKRGRDGKDGRDAVQTPVVSIVGAK